MTTTARPRHRRSRPAWTRSRWPPTRPSSPSTSASSAWARTHRIEELPSDNPDKPQRLPAEWNANPGGHYAFRYKHPQSSMEYLLKINRMGGKAVVLGMGLGDDKTTSFDVVVKDFVSDGNLPATLAAAVDNDNTDGDDIKRKITDVYISPGRLSDLGSLMRLNVIQKLIPSLQKAGYEETGQETTQRGAPSSSSSTTDSRTRDPLRNDRPDDGRPPWPLQDPLAHPPRRQMPEPMPGFDDEHEIMRPPRGIFGGGGDGGPRIGDRDLYPAGLGPNDPIRGGVGPGLGPMGGGGGGMHPTFDDPLFAGQGRRGGGGGGGGGRRRIRSSSPHPAAVMTPSDPVVVSEEDTRVELAWEVDLPTHSAASATTTSSDGRHCGLETFCILSGSVTKNNESHEEQKRLSLV